MTFRVFKTTYKDRKGKTQESSKWYVEFRDHLETVRRLPAFTSKPASEEFGRNIVKLVEHHKASGGQVDPSLSRWLAGLPQKTREKLVSIGLLDRERAAVNKLLADHLKDWQQALTAKGNSAYHIEVVTGRARRVLLDDCKFRYYSDISASKVQNHLNELRQDKKDKRGISSQTFNFYLQAIKQFCRWMIRDRRALESPVAHLSGLNVKTDRRRDRRAFTVEELRALLAAASGGPDRHGMTGTDRTLLYWLAVETGLRAGELRSLTRASFDLNDTEPTVTVLAEYSKRRRQDVLPLRPDLAAALRVYFADKMPATPAFRIPVSRKLASKMFQADLRVASIAHYDDAGRVADFHALRHTFISNLAAGGVHPKMAQTLTRHSTITLTMDRYTHTCRGAESDALNVLPDLTRPAPVTLRSTGTEGAPRATGNETNESVLAFCLARQQRFQGISVDSDGRSPVSDVESQGVGNTAISADFPAVGSVCTSGGGPGLQNQWRV